MGARYSSRKGYNQNTNEMVIIIIGSAEVPFEENKGVIKMKQGVHTDIPAHKKHRVQETDRKIETIWLAVHYL